MQPRCNKWPFNRAIQLLIQIYKMAATHMQWTNIEKPKSHSYEDSLDTQNIELTQSSTY